jgi:hypothetical protein
MVGIQITGQAIPVDVTIVAVKRTFVATQGLSFGYISGLTLILASTLKSQEKT